MLTSQIILLVIASFVVIFGVIMNTSNILSLFIFRIAPLVVAILLTLIAFKVIV